jgi:hypothetical protein
MPKPIQRKAGCQVKGSTHANAIALVPALLPVLLLAVLRAKPPALLLNPLGNKLSAKFGARLLALASKKAIALGAAHAHAKGTAALVPKWLGNGDAPLLLWL